MFKCQSCHKSTKKQFRIVTKKRPKTYTYYLVKVSGGAGHKPILTTNDELAKREGNKILKKKVTKGWEIAEQLVLCENCYNKKETK